VATSFDVLYCLEDEAERAALREMHRIVRPGGLVLITVAALDILRGSHSTLTQEVRRYTRAGLRARVESAGFQVQRLTFTNGAIFPLTLVARLADRLRGRTDVASTANLQVPPAPLNAILDGVLRLEARALRHVDVPIGSSLLCVARRLP
jgi:hypothetical protein